MNGIGDYALQDVSGTVITPHKNQVGTTMRHTDATQAVVNTYEYDAWGQPFVTTEGASTKQQIRFSQKELDPDFVDFNSVNRRYVVSQFALIPFRDAFLQKQFGASPIPGLSPSFANVSPAEPFDAWQPLAEFESFLPIQCCSPLTQSSSLMSASALPDTSKKIHSDEEIKRKAVKDIDAATRVLNNPAAGGGAKLKAASDFRDAQKVLRGRLPGNIRRLASDLQEAVANCLGPFDLLYLYLQLLAEIKRIELIRVSLEGVADENIGKVKTGAEIALDTLLGLQTYLKNRPTLTPKERLEQWANALRARLQGVAEGLEGK